MLCDSLCRWSSCNNFAPLHHKVGVDTLQGMYKHLHGRSGRQHRPGCSFHSVVLTSSRLDRSVSSCLRSTGCSRGRISPYQSCTRIVLGCNMALDQCLAESSFGHKLRSPLGLRGENPVVCRLLCSGSIWGTHKEAAQEPPGKRLRSRVCRYNGKACCSATGQVGSGSARVQHPP